MSRIENELIELTFSFSIERGALSSLQRSRQAKRQLHEFVEEVITKAFSVYNSYNVVNQTYHSPHLITNTECSICLDPFNLYTTISVLPCKHGFHKKCMDSMIMNDYHECPVCRHSF